MMVGNVNELRWCDHKAVAAGHMIGAKGLAKITGSDPTWIVIEEGKFKILCERCFFEGSKGFY